MLFVIDFDYLRIAPLIGVARRAVKKNLHGCAFLLLERALVYGVECFYIFYTGVVRRESA